MSQKQLPPHEWMIVACLIILLGVLTLIAQFNDRGDLKAPILESTENEHQSKSQNSHTKKNVQSYMTVYLEGAVQVKGALQVPKGTTYKKLLDLVKFEPSADVSHFKKNNKKLTDREVIKVEFLKD